MIDVQGTGDFAPGNRVATPIRTQTGRSDSVVDREETLPCGKSCVSCFGELPDATTDVKVGATVLRRHAV